MCFLNLYVVIVNGLMLVMNLNYSCYVLIGVMLVLGSVCGGWDGG